jgi:ribosome biogenesis protein UTP30
VLKASAALLRHMKSEAAKGSAKGTKNLFAVDEADAQAADNAEGVWCQIGTKKHIIDEKRLKPTKVPLPHTLNLVEATSICIITPDPQRTFKDVVSHPHFLSALGKQIRILGVTKLKQRYKTFEARRQLRAQYDVFLADDRIITMLPRLLGKIFYEHGKRPMPIRLAAPKVQDANGKYVKPAKTEGKSVLTPAGFAQEIEQALTSSRIHLTPSTTTAVQVGWSVFTPEAVAANITALIEGMVKDDIIPHGWRNIRSIHIKGPTTVALPVWMAEQLWVDEEDVIEDAEAAEIAKQREKKSGKRKGRVLEEEAEPGEKHKKIKAASEQNADDFSQEMATRREALRKAKQAGRDAADEREAVALKKSVKKKRDGSVQVEETRAVAV